MYIKFKIATFMLVIFILAFSISHIFKVENNNLDINCTSTFQIPSMASKYILSGRTTFSFKPDGNGMIEVDGRVNNDKGLTKNTSLRRKLTFSYHYNKNGEINMSDIIVTKYTTDNFEDRFFNAFLFDLSTRERTIKISRLENAYLMSNAFSPVFMCVTR